MRVFKFKMCDKDINKLEYEVIIEEKTERDEEVYEKSLKELDDLRTYEHKHLLKENEENDFN